MKKWNEQIEWRNILGHPFLTEKLTAARDDLEIASNSLQFGFERFNKDGSTPSATNEHHKKSLQASWKRRKLRSLPKKSASSQEQDGRDFIEIGSTCSAFLRKIRCAITFGRAVGGLS